MAGRRQHRPALALVPPFALIAAGSTTVAVVPAVELSVYVRPIAIEAFAAVAPAAAIADCSAETVV